MKRSQPLLPRVLRGPIHFYCVLGLDATAGCDAAHIIQWSTFKFDIRLTAFHIALPLSVSLCAAKPTLSPHFLPVPSANRSLRGVRLYSASSRDSALLINGSDGLILGTTGMRGDSRSLRQSFLNNATVYCFLL